jgi:hypothetical protein
MSAERGRASILSRAKPHPLPNSWRGWPVRFAAVLATLPALVHAQMLIEWDGRERHDRSHDVAGGKFTELCAKLGAGDRVQWSFAADRPLDFNIHYHVGKDVRYPAKAEGSTGSSGMLAVTEPQDYCWMWSNRGSASVEVKAKLDRSR